MTKKLAFLGYGLRSKTMLQAFREIEADISVAAVADPRWEQIKEENAGDPLFAEARYFENAVDYDELMSRNSVYREREAEERKTHICRIQKMGEELIK